MKTFKKDGLLFALAQAPVQAGLPRENANWGIAEIDAAEARGVKVLVFPEQFVSGYVIGDKFEDDAFVRDVWRQNDRIVAATKGKNITAVLGTTVIDNPEATGEHGRLRKINGGIVAQNGKTLKSRAGLPFFAKTNIPKYRMFDEVRHMTTLTELAFERSVSVQDLLQPFDVMIDGQIVVIGVITCEDGWPKDYFIKPPLILALKGIDLLINVSASPSGWQKNRARHEAFGPYLAKLGIPMIYVNISGTQNNGKNMYGFDGVTTVYNKSGLVAASLPPYFEGVQDVLVKPDMPAVLFQEPDDVVQLWNGWKYGMQGILKTIPSHLHNISIGLSGGLDSAVVAAAMACILPKERFSLLNMPYSTYNGPEGRAAAQHIADALGIPLQIFPIDDPVNWKAEKHGIEPGSGAFTTLMAIERGNTLAIDARSKHGVYTSNGNKAELALNFFTNDGDGRGAFAPLGDMLKGEVAQLAYFLNTEVYKREVIPWELITHELPPKDELGPEGSSDPFDYGRVLRDGTFVRGYHDQMVHAFIGFRKDPEWLLEQYIAGTLENTLLLDPGKLDSLFVTPTAFVADVERCWSALHASVWKRVQSPTNVALSKRPFGFDYRESLLPAYYTDHYYELKRDLVGAV